MRGRRRINHRRARRGHGQDRIDAIDLLRGGYGSDAGGPRCIQSAWAVQSEQSDSGAQDLPLLWIWNGRLQTQASNASRRKRSLKLTSMASLKFENGPNIGERISLERDKTTFGRARWNDCVLAHPTASREHFYVERNAGKLFLVDHGSENGTHVNGERVSWI